MNLIDCKALIMLLDNNLHVVFWEAIKKCLLKMYKNITKMNDVSQEKK